MPCRPLYRGLKLATVHRWMHAIPSRCFPDTTMAFLFHSRKDRSRGDIPLFPPIGWRPASLHSMVITLPLFTLSALIWMRLILGSFNKSLVCTSLGARPALCRSSRISTASGSTSWCLLRWKKIAGCPAREKWVLARFIFREAAEKTRSVGDHLAKGKNI